MPQHGEAFHRMLYRCEDRGGCGFEEWIWNSRDGVTPFCIDCRRCGKDANHVEWTRDEYRPDYTPQPGERFFRDGTPEEARAIFRRRLEQGKGTPYEVPEVEWDVWIAEALSGRSSEFQPGWPHVQVQEP